MLTFFYIGETGRPIGVRGEQHLDCFLKIRKPTAVDEHILKCDFCKDALKRKELSHKIFVIQNK